MRAGIMVAIMKSLFISDSAELDLVDFFTNSNKTIKSLNLGRMMMAFTVLNINNNQVQFINAGMPPIFIYKKSNNTVIEFETQGMSLGAISESSFNINKFSVDSGDAILIPSDGLPELKNEKNEQYDYARVKEEFKSVANKTPNDVVEYLKTSASNWANGVETDDDVTFVVIKVK